MHHSEEELLKSIVLLFILTFLEFYVIIYTENERGVNIIKLWIDDTRRPPDTSWLWCRTVNGAKSAIRTYESNMRDDTITIDLDHDAGDYVKDGGDYIEILNWLERDGIVDTGYFFHIHSMNTVGIQNMRAIIEHNGWREIK